MSSSNSRQVRRQAETKRLAYTDNYVSRWLSLFHNSIEFENLPNDLPKRYLLRQLARKGSIAYDKETKLWLSYCKQGIDIYGLPTAYTLIGFNGRTLQRKADKVVILRINDLSYPILNYLENQAEKVVDIDMAIAQNLEATKTTAVMEVEDDSQLLSATNEIENRRVGALYVYVNKNSALGSKLNVQQTGAVYLVDKLQEARQKIINETLQTLGIAVSNTDKRERVQTAEIEASFGIGIDCINTLVNTFNYDAKVGGLDIRAKANTSISMMLEQEKENKKDEME